MSERTTRSDRWLDDAEEDRAAPFKALTRQEAQALREKQPPVSPWRVVLSQAGLGLLIAALAWSISGERSAGLSALYGAAVVVMPAALMARGMTGRLAGGSPQGRAVSFMLWQAVKTGLSVCMLVLAPWLLSPLNWPALLVGLVVCLKVYWVALRWRGR